jgi:hypothetical protein
MSRRASRVPSKNGARSRSCSLTAPISSRALQQVMGSPFCWRSGSSPSSKSLVVNVTDRLSFPVSGLPSSMRLAQLRRHSRSSDSLISVPRLTPRGGCAVGALQRAVSHEAGSSDGSRLRSNPGPQCGGAARGGRSIARCCCESRTSSRWEARPPPPSLRVRARPLASRSTPPARAAQAGPWDAEGVGWGSRRRAILRRTFAER